MTGAELTAMYRLLAVAGDADRYVIPSAYAEQGHQLEETACSLDFDGGPGMVDSEPFGAGSDPTVPAPVQTFDSIRGRRTAAGDAGSGALHGRLNMLNWNGQGVPNGLFPPARPAAADPQVHPSDPGSATGGRL